MAGAIKVIIETPKGSSLKYAYDQKSRFFLLKKILPSGMIFPYDFGFVPDTKGGDGDPLDILVISEFSSFPGCMMECRVIGAFEAEQKEIKEGKVIRNDRFFCVPLLTTIFAEMEKLEDLPVSVTNEIESFFIQYNKEEGKEFRVLKKLGPKKAIGLIDASRI